jgi:hypothetical protein
MREVMRLDAQGMRRVRRPRTHVPAKNTLKDVLGYAMKFVVQDGEYPHFVRLSHSANNHYASAV